MKKSKLYICCDDSIDRADWIFYSAKGEVNGQENNVILAEIKHKINLDEATITIFMVSTKLYIKEITVPKNITVTRLNKIIPSLLEEEIISHIDMVHFSHNKVSHDEKVGICIVDKQLFAGWLNSFQAIGIFPDTITPICTALSGNNKTWKIMYEADKVSVNISNNYGFCIEPHHLSKMLEFVYTQVSSKPECIEIYFTNKELENEFQNQWGSLQDRPIFSLFKTKIINAVWDILNLQKNNINLFQGQYEKKEVTVKKSYLIHAFLISVITFLTMTSVELIKIVKYEHKNDELTSKINTLYKQLYPNATSIVNPKLRMEQELKKLPQKQNGFFFSLLSQVGPLINKNNSIRIPKADYKNQTLTLMVESDNFKQIEIFLSELKMTNLNARQTKTEQAGGKFIAVIVVSRKIE